jgi:hypothetical protein
LRAEETLLNGELDGLRKYFSKDGLLDRMCEYRNGLPWNDVCWLREGKAYWAEFRSGKPFNGCVAQPGDGDEVSAECYIDGRLVTVEEFMSYHSLTQVEKETLSGIDVFSPEQWKMQTVSPSDIETSTVSSR